MTEPSIRARFEALGAATKPQPQAPPAPRTLHVVGSNPAYVDAAVRRELEAVAAAVEGTRNDQLNRSAFNVGTLVAGGEIAASEAASALLGAAVGAGLPESEARATIASALRAASDSPRTAPPPTPRDDDFGWINTATGEIASVQESPAFNNAERAPDLNAEPSLTDADPAHEDLTWAATGDIPEVEPPTLGTRDDGAPLWYAGKVNGIFGEPESAKTWIAMHAAVEALCAGQRAVLVDIDHNGAILTVQRLALLGVAPAVLADAERFRYYAPEDRTDLALTIAQAADFAPAIAIIDSLGELVPMIGGDSKDNDHITTALRLTAFPLAASGAAVITVDHLPKAVESRDSGYAIGGMAKKRAMNGTYIRAEVIAPCAPGAVGRVALKVAKDRSGKVREHSPGGHAGTFTLDSTDPSRAIAVIHAAEVRGDTFRPTVLMQRVSAHLAGLAPEGQSQNGIQADVGGNAGALRTAVRALADEGYLTQKPGAKGGGSLYFHARHYDQMFDEKAE